MNIEITSPLTPQDFDNYYDLRWRILRKPWDQPKGSEKDNDEESSSHIIAKLDARIVGCCRVQMNTEQEAQLRYMAVDDDLQGKGIGKLLLKEAEKKAKEKGAKTMILEARELAVDFYKNAGYQIIRKSKIIFGVVQHYTMGKTLAP